jgi:hypothetical protein
MYLQAKTTKINRLTMIWLIQEEYAALDLRLETVAQASKTSWARNTLSLAQEAKPWIFQWRICTYLILRKSKAWSFRIGIATYSLNKSLNKPCSREECIQRSLSLAKKPLINWSRIKTCKWPKQLTASVSSILNSAVLTFKGKSRLRIKKLKRVN